MKLTDKRFWNWRTYMVLLIVAVLIAIVISCKRTMVVKTAEIERVGNEIIVKIEDFQDKYGRIPVSLNELGAPFEDNNETYDYQGQILYYEPTKDGKYWLTVTFGPDEDYIYYSQRKYWRWNYDTELTSGNVKNCLKKCSSHINRYGSLIVFVQIPTVSTRSTHRLRIR
ncbi:hypothetical protein [Muribaculum intestinale]|uniref:hypothetical protein n=1 Tax=Muribaculum intestinale TaxID=1796646 RepID=UPI002432DF53|nr:hypothetical protein [Muribaculum intestinale]